MGDVTFAVEARNERGKGAARKLRARGMAPGIVYGGGGEATPIAFEIKGLDRLIATSHGGLNTLIDLAGDSDATGRTVIAKELQREPIRGGITHADFYEVNLSQKIEVSVPIHLIGTPAGVVLGGVLDQQQREVSLLCLPNAIPDAIEVDVSALELGDSLHIEQITIPDGADLMTEGALTVATVLVPRGLKDAAAGDAEESDDAAGEDATSSDS